jgi:predicted transcriptional regulator of viral defense system
MLSIQRRTSVVILRSELAGLASRSQLSRALKKLVEAGMLVRISHGVYAKTRFNKFLKRPAPAGTLESIAAEVFRKLGIDVGPGNLANEYNAGLSTQVPMLAVVTTGRRRICRRIQVGSRSVSYERERVNARKRSGA